MRLRLLLATLLALATAGAAYAQTRQPFPAGSDVMTASVQPGYFAHQKVVYQNDGGLPDDRTYFEILIRSINNHLIATGGDVEISVVNFGDGAEMLRTARTDPTLAAQIDALRAKGVRFLVCRNSMRGMKVRPEDLYKTPPEDVVPAGVAELARLQGLGYVLIHV